ncbi:MULTISPECIES: amidohydrolase family protein [unclassified Chelatococcus]|uniref:metal-dependent hydrolase family protein n=1 Tax=unclassified Chelatococcus TaxID=2638111 RepID=UPI001BCBEBAA|nr:MULTISPECIES: amidohydrolase family protein [unclassified Chelatococcus]CAH1661377.1 Imidazolonepropionase-like amidohydrolase [Hyphomicrobiales bacterium]MBS7741246.1 amidohydrolase family protein [Chelatococcus sp. HY11]MBX3546272.1 amidohydrolase family protein [Chelatococcus sp.]MCO5078069.1 amidohydrolase family protein [Chelatococcus sp.]CAH1683120.1 Imidazolonepropionase-like amidohydrolase [Hyphomicrobiales bacterium]
MSTILFQNADILDGRSDEALAGHHVLVENGEIREVSDKPIQSSSAVVVDLAGKTLMPGLIDCHVHVIATTTNLGLNAELPNTLVALRSAKIMRDMLMRGFTTVRDLGGAEYGLVQAIDEGLIEAPRLVICGKALSQTGGHTDYRGRYHARNVDYYADRAGTLGRVVDGVDALRRAAREEIKGGAQFIKIMANGGVSSPTDPIAFLGFSDDELRAAVEEAHHAQTYVAAHLYTDEGIRRAVELGVESVEHGNLITAETARLVKERGAYVVPTNVTFDYLAKEGASYGLPPESVAKIEDVRAQGLAALEILHNADVMMAYGSDLLGEMHRHQSDEFLLRRDVLPAIEVIRSATINAAKVVRQEGKLGVVAAGAHADLIVVDGNPLKDMALLTGQGKHMPAIMKAGHFVKNELGV